MFSHLKLRVYEKALASVARLAAYSGKWDKRHAVVDQLQRASESIVLNIAEGARLWRSCHKRHLLDYAIGSTLECAACLDIAGIKRFLLPDVAGGEKACLAEVVRMLVGLRQSWEENLHEDSTSYNTQEKIFFAHERLDAYRVGLEFMRWFHGLPAGADLSSRLYRQVDKAATSAVLNIAEGNGRFPPDDRRSFLDIATGSAVKAAAYLDLCQAKAELDPEQNDRGVDLLAHLARLTHGLSVSCRAEAK